MPEWLTAISAGWELPSCTGEELDAIGFAIVPGPVTGAEDLDRLSSAYDEAVASAAPEDVKVGSSTTRVTDFVNRGPEFDALYVHPPVLQACWRILQEPFRLSTMHARTLRPGVPAQDLHVDYERDDRGWTMAGFIFMVDEFRRDNGATRFVPGSHLWDARPAALAGGRKADYPGQVSACGPAGSTIVFNGSVWHGHTANFSGQPRRSLQGAYIRRQAPSGVDLAARMTRGTLTRISPLAKYLLAV